MCTAHSLRASGCEAIISYPRAVHSRTKCVFYGIGFRRNFLSHKKTANNLLRPIFKSYSKLFTVVCRNVHPIVNLYKIHNFYMISHIFFNIKCFLFLFIKIFYNTLKCTCVFISFRNCIFNISQFFAIAKNSI